eukprot:CAMPEP_0195532728 /NCGR_PEP_ID=MMETSP0794_2-20130614/38951_1 /TAXON_ID=515487 /ORGANISM="Stephanopyxis turris, Strain CCMP 815" /LENGTH=152 /DNA_ID=CAMNT_0040665057 /DNA_START=265 /DNA_END=723 /DNA_ORIENTATION=+
MLNLFGFGNKEDEKNKTDPKKKDKDFSSSSSSSDGGGGAQNSQSQSMGDTASTMENFKTQQVVGKRTSSLLEELSSTTITGIAPGGKVKVFVSGQQRPKGIEIDDSYLGVVTPEDLVADITAAMQDAHFKSTEHMNKKMQILYSELGLPATS